MTTSPTEMRDREPDELPGEDPNPRYLRVRMEQLLQDRIREAADREGISVARWVSEACEAMLSSGRPALSLVGKVAERVVACPRGTTDCKVTYRLGKPWCVRHGRLS